MTPEKEFQYAFASILEVLITCVTSRGKARVMLHIGTGHCNNKLIMLKLFRYNIICNNLQHKTKIEVNLVIPDLSITHIANRGKTRVMLHRGTGHSNNSQIIL